MRGTGEERFAPPCVPEWVSTSPCVRECVCVRCAETVTETRTDSQGRGFFLSWIRERGLRRALFPVVHSCGDLVTPVPSQPVS